MYFDSYSVTRGSGKNSRTYYYNQYWISLQSQRNPNSDICVFNKSLYVSQDNGLLEIEVRAIGELLSKILKINLIRIDGSVIEPDKLDESVINKLNDFVKTNYLFKTEPFYSQEIDKGFCINKILYYNVKKIVFGTIFIIAASIIGIIVYIYLNYHKQSYEFIEKQPNPFYTVIMIILIVLLAIFLIIFLVKNSKYKAPRFKPLIYIYKDKILSTLKIKDNNIISSDTSSVAEIEEISVRYERSLGYSVKLISDNFSKRVAYFNNVNKANYLRDEILSALKILADR